MVIENINISSMSTEKAMTYVAEMIDEATDSVNAEKARMALNLCNELAEKIQGISEVELFYFRANACSVIRHANHKDESAIWYWNQPELLQEVYWLRSAIRSEYFVQLEPFRQCQIFVNTGNVFSHIGRPIEAIEYWKRALAVMPNFAMALGNLGFGLAGYAKLQYDFGHANILLKHAYDYLYSIKKQAVIWDGHDHKEIAVNMVTEAEQIRLHIDIDRLENFSLNGFSLGKTKSEQSYRRWALDSDLFLNSLNDLGAFSIAAHDVLHLPDMVMPVGEHPSLIGFFNQLKQEFVSARYMLWQGLSGKESYKKHYSDKDVLLFNTLDYPAYGLAIEQIKLAFRSAYSLFDKIAFFINEYWLLEMKESDINFQSVWFEVNKNTKTKELRRKFHQHANLSLRGLYWISRDFIEKDDKAEFVLGNTMEPDSDKLRTIRNHLEHKYFKVHDEFWMLNPSLSGSSLSDELAYSLSVKEFSDKTLRLLKQARAALIYLSLAVHREENIKASLNSEDKFIVPMILPEWE